MTERDAKILEMYQAGELIKSIAASVGMAPNSVGQVLKRLGVERPGKPQKRIKQYDENLVIQLWDGGLSTSAIAERVKLSRVTVVGLLRLAGREVDAARRVRYDGEGGTIARGGNAFARIARRT